MNKNIVGKFKNSANTIKLNTKSQYTLTNAKSMRMELSLKKEQ